MMTGMNQDLSQPAILPIDPNSRADLEQALRERDLHLSQSHVQSSTDAPDAQATEIALLRDHLRYLQTELTLSGTVGPAAPPVAAPVAFEAAIARLLADLVRETDRRILAEREVLTTRATLRRHGIDSPTQPARPPVAPRPLLDL